LAGAKVVFVETRAGHYERRKVTVGATAGGYHEIVSGVAVGEAIVTHGAFLLKSEILRDPTE
jgi:cobalt-zinc-cadmium efflux system membrane fusion protein